MKNLILLLHTDGHLWSQAKVVGYSC